MVNKLNDLKPKTKLPKPKHFWTLKPKSKKSLFVSILVGLFILINLAIILAEGGRFIQDFKDTTKRGVGSLFQARASVAVANFEAARASFLEAEKLFTNLNQNSWFLSNSIANPDLLLNSATILSSVGQELTLIADDFLDLPDQFLKANQAFLTNSETESLNLTAPIRQNLAKITTINQSVNQVINNLNRVNTTVFPSSVRQDFNNARAEIQNLYELLIRFQNYLDLVLDLLGDQVPHTYLILLQNNYEIRPAGGFLGSMIFAEVDQGVLTQFDFKDVYDFDGIFTNNPDYLPPEYEGFNELLWIRDANYTPDFAISAARIESLMQQAKAPSFDTVISIDQTLIEDVLTITGPVLLPSYNANITAENFFTVLTYLVEAKKYENEDDKGILSEFIQSFQNALFDSIDFQLLAGIFIQNLDTKHLQLFSKKPAIQTQIEFYNFGNRFQAQNIPKNHNYLLVTNTSIGGNKTDKFIKQRLIYNTHFNPDNSIQNTLTIRRHHSFTDAQELRWQSQLRPFGVTQMVDYTRYILGRGDNLSMVKVFVPNNTKLLSVAGLDSTAEISQHLDPDLNNQYFLFPIRVKPGQTTEVSLKFAPQIRLNPNPTDTYYLHLQSQAGALNTHFNKTYTFSNPESQRIFSHQPEISAFDPDGNPTINFSFSNDITLRGLYSSIR